MVEVAAKIPGAALVFVIIMLGDCVCFNSNSDLNVLPINLCFA